MFQVIRTRNKEIMNVQSCFLSTTLQIWCYCGHVIKSRTMRHLNFDCQLNLSKSHKGFVIISCVVSAQCRKAWLRGGEKRPPPCEIGLTEAHGRKDLLHAKHQNGALYHTHSSCSLTLTEGSAAQRCPDREIFCRGGHFENQFTVIACSW